MARKIYADPTVIVCSGEKYQWLYDVECRDGSTMPSGSILKVLGPTQQTPYGEIGPQNVNWLCEAANGITVWATLEQCLERGLLRKIK